MRIALMTFLVAAAGLLTASVWAKQQSRFVTEAMRKNAIKNAGEYEWAQRQQQKATDAADRWLQLTDRELWKLVPSQKLPRTRYVNKEFGCPKCGKETFAHGKYAWLVNFWERPWKIECPNCHEVYPKNDFQAYYESALDEHGFFQPELGDKSLLYNEEHPDPDDPLHTVLVDDGYGMKDEDGRRYDCIAYYT
ncbi:MAG: hypothetical protein ACLFWB_05565, partial [Armatimonadota bacterium]